MLMFPQTTTTRSLKAKAQPWLALPSGTSYHSLSPVGAHGVRPHSYTSTLPTQPNKYKFRHPSSLENQKIHPFSKVIMDKNQFFSQTALHTYAFYLKNTTYPLIRAYPHLSALIRTYPTYPHLSEPIHPPSPQRISLKKGFTVNIGKSLPCTPTYADSDCQGAASEDSYLLVP